ncbi:Beta-glucosidase [Xylanimonas cellulosilytica DSM 15894]|uniref:Beta-glucosidase n=1 Tax=Xylanimonas cellulosilytica (strain DSM 15894 / JCM 12276 / CECT 5975 / KCTC 9989 / LMG 20990 / NBRC 107835 / XIL07) TaxID=446471 RepID=D1C037_XYLCX|nr:glycoside hydrolase family 3 protein [Xylanimonas cellulosilytica]ACZ30226.1 Beta-glucosidase [Xylanimonas cellulosilytica DSM 15894]
MSIDPTDVAPPPPAPSDLAPSAPASSDLAPFRDPGLPAIDRAKDLLARLTREERVAMLHQHAPAVERLGLAPFHTGAEALHGVAWLGRATVLPQAVGLGATWDPDLLERLGELVATEQRAKHAEDPQVSLNVWAPVVNTLRHPAWGRNEEGYAEDPHLTAHLATAYCRGLRGDHPTVWKTVPTLKHFLGYGNETDRSSTSSNLSQRTLHEEELAAFREPIEQGVAGAVMPSYNRVNGEPAHTSGALFDELRSWAPDEIALVSDAWAPTALVTVQRAFADHVESHAAALQAGLDSFTDGDAASTDTVERLTQALDRGLVTEADVDRAVLRLLHLRVRTGEFDAATNGGPADPYAGIGADAIDLPAHRVLAREAAAKSVVVLTNDGVLPLASPRRVAVVGPLADAVLTDWYSGTPPYAVTLADGLRERYPDATVTAVGGHDVVALRATSTDGYLVASEDGAAVAADGATGDGPALWDLTDWGDGIVTLRSQASTRLLTGAGWPARADADRVGGWVVQESFRRHLHPDGTVSLQHLGSNRWLRVTRGTLLAGCDGTSVEEAERFVLRTVTSGHESVRAAAAGADVVVVAVGNDPHLSGRETQDRPHLRLPECAAELLRTAQEANASTVLAIVSSFPYVLPAAARRARAVVWSSHGGQELGHGLVDVLSGDVEPYGRLAQQWPVDEAQPGDLLDYDTHAQKATYRHTDREPAFAFGHGLTYSDVAYGGLTLSTPRVPAPAPTLRHAPLGAGGEAGPGGDGAVSVTVEVANAGERPADELVQVYALGPQDLPLATPRRLLLGFRRVRLAPGESRDVTITVDVARLAVWDPDARVDGARADGAAAGWLYEGALRVQPGEYRIAAGPSSSDLPSVALLTVG